MIFFSCGTSILFLFKKLITEIIVYWLILTRINKNNFHKLQKKTFYFTRHLLNIGSQELCFGSHTDEQEDMATAFRVSNNIQYLIWGLFNFSLHQRFLRGYAMNEFQQSWQIPVKQIPFPIDFHY